MERTKGLQKGAKKLLAAMFLAAALASTGCGQNALLNPTADQVSGGTSQTSNKTSSDLNPVSADLNP
jgi:predicted small lipoprotein YifL